MKRTLSLLVLALMSTTATITAQVPKLNSYPTASATIYLDFDGHNVSSVYWNGGTAFDATPYAYTAEQITTMFNMVAEDFKPFNLNVTTDSTVYFAAPTNKRQRIIITTNSAWYGNAGGVAYIGSFTWGLEVPGFVFSNLLGNNTKYVGEAISHETGHTLNLQHQSKYDASCNFLREYHDGAGSGETSWAPIMGVGYYKNLTLWHKGSSSLGCSSVQDDIAVIAGTRNGFGFRADDAANDYRSSSPVQVTDSTYEISGVLNNTTDLDVYSFTLNQQGRFSVAATPYSLNPAGNVNANIDGRIELLNGSGAIIATFNPYDFLHANIDTTLNTGTYYLRMSSVSNANTTNYGMLGSYKLKGFIGGAAVVTTPPPPPPPTTQEPTYSLTVNLTGTASGTTHKLSWTNSGTDVVSTTTVEISKDGTTYSKLADVASGVTSYTTTYTSKGTAYYRVTVKGTSQKIYYSNMLALKVTKTIGKAAASMVMGNTVTTQALVNSTESSNWRLLDMNGKLMSSGRFTNGVNNINTQQLIPGVYLLQVMENEEITTHKIIKQ